MQKIKFRGISVTTKKFVYGYLIKKDNYFFIVNFNSFKGERFTNDCGSDVCLYHIWERVIPKTISMIKK